MCASPTPGARLQRPRRTRVTASLALSALLAAGPASAEPCSLGRLAELPVTMQGLRPLVHAKINGKDALFVADSGAFFSFLTPPAAQEFNLSLQMPPLGYGVSGVGGQARVWVTTVKTFTIFNIDVPKVPFLVAGNDLGAGAVGLLGQNVFRLGDVEYDLANGMIRILRTHGDCRKNSLAYWANAQHTHYSEIEIDSATAQHPHTEADAYLNGRKIRVLLDTGAPASVLTLDSARSAGITTDSPDVKPGGPWYGIGRRVGRSWIAPVTSFKIGDEEIRNTHLRIGETGLNGVDMLMGADFFLSHRILVASNLHRLYFTYNGGPVFNLTTLPASAPAAAEPAAAGDEPGTAPGAEAAAPGPAATAAQPAPQAQLDAAGYARRGSASASRHDYEHALADLTQAITLAPTEPDYFYQRGMAYWANRQPDKALEDLGRAIELKPDHVNALMARATLHAQRNDPVEVFTPDLDAADRAAPKESETRLALAGLYERARNYPAAIVQFDDWINSHNRDEVRMPQAFNGRCWVRAVAAQGLDQALDDCNAAVRANPKVAAFHDSRALVYLRMGRYDKALADYDAALALDPRIAWSLYGRGLAKQHLGQAAAGDADIAAAKALSPKIAEEAASHGIGP